jgi:hypothetical protein
MEASVTGSENGSLGRSIAGFLRDIGLDISFGEIAGDTFLPGILVKDGGLVIDEAKLRYPGDLLHEAGHLAFAPSAIRSTISGEVVLPDVNAAVVEVQAIAWSYAAAVFLGIDPAVVFHRDGYHGKSEAILFNISIGNILGLPGLSEHGMAYSPSRAAELGVAPFPVMHKWLAD